MRIYNQNKPILHSYTSYNIKKPLFVLYNKKEAFIKSICFFAIGCALLSITREQFPLVFSKNTELKHIILFLGELVSGFYLIFRGLRYDDIYCILINKSISTDLKKNDEMIAVTSLLCAFFMLSGHFFGPIISLILGAFSMIGTKIIYINSELIYKIRN